MDKVELYRQVFASFRTLCAEGKQPSSFNSYCKAHGVEQSLMRHILKDEFQNVKTLSGFQFSRSAGDHAVGKSVLRFMKSLNVFVRKDVSQVHSRHIAFSMA